MEISEWAFSVFGEEFSGYDTLEEAEEGIRRLIKAGYNEDDFRGPYPKHTDEDGYVED